MRGMDRVTRPIPTGTESRQNFYSINQNRGCFGRILIHSAKIHELETQRDTLLAAHKLYYELLEWIESGIMLLLMSAK